MSGKVYAQEKIICANDQEKLPPQFEEPLERERPPVFSPRKGFVYTRPNTIFHRCGIVDPKYIYRVEPTGEHFSRPNLGSGGWTGLGPGWTQCRVHPFHRPRLFFLLRRTFRRDRFASLTAFSLACGQRICLCQGFTTVSGRLDYEYAANGANGASECSAGIAELHLDRTVACN